MKTKLEKIQLAVLLAAGTLLLLISGLILANTAAFFGANEIQLNGHPSLLNELKAPAGMLLGAGLFMIVAIFRRGLADTATALAALIYLSYAASRGLSMLLDGVPASGLVQAAIIEAVIGLACLTVLMLRNSPARRVA